MVLKKYLSALVVLQLIASSLFISWASTSTAFAQSAGGLCVLDGYPSVSIEGVYPDDGAEVVEVDLSVSNRSTYLYPDVRPFLALFEEGEVIPSYILNGTDSYPLLPDTAVSVGIAADTSFVPAGTYELKAFVGQGDMNHLLAVAIRDADETGVEFQKLSPATSNVPVEISVNGTTANGQTLQFDVGTPLTVETKTTNSNDASFRDAELSLVLTQGEMPAGTALSQTKTETIKLIPGSTRTTKMIDRTTLAGEYTLYATIESANNFQRLYTVPVQLGEDEGDGNFMYLSGIGLNREGNQVSVATCVDRTDGDISEFYTGQFSVSLNDSQSVEFGGNAKKSDLSATFSSTMSELKEGVDISIGVALDYVAPIDGEEVLSQADQFVDEYQATDQVSIVLECVNGICEEVGEGSGAPVVMESTNRDYTQGFFHFAGIVIAAALLAYIMIRRLPPETQKKDGEEPMHQPE